MGDVLNVFDFVEGKVERGKAGESVEAFDVRDEVVIEIDFEQGGAEGGGEVDGCYGVLSEAEALEFGEAVEVEGGDGGDAAVDEVYVFGIYGVVIEEIFIGFNLLGRRSVWVGVVGI